MNINLNRVLIFIFADSSEEISFNKSQFGKTSIFVKNHISVRRFGLVNRSKIFYSLLYRMVLIESSSTN